MSHPHSEDTLYAAYIQATPEEQPGLFIDLVAAMRRHAFAVCWQILTERRPDIVNHAVARALQALPNFRGDSKFSTWFHTIIKNSCRSELHTILTRRAREVSLDALPETTLNQLAAPDTTPIERLHLEQLVATLPPKTRECLRLLMRGNSLQEIAALLGEDYSRIKARASFGRRRLSALLKAQHATQ